MPIEPFIRAELEERFVEERRQLDEAQAEILELMEMTESPLEQRFLLHCITRLNGENRVNQLNGLHLMKADYFSPGRHDAYLRIYPQYPVEGPLWRPSYHQQGSFRADFLFQVTYWNFAAGKHLIAAEVVVEIDGHDFHERTKEQAQRDRSRDRLMITSGLQVLRFTGWEVYHHLEEVVQEIDEYISDIAMDMMGKGQGRVI